MNDQRQSNHTDVGNVERESPLLLDMEDMMSSVLEELLTLESPTAEEFGKHIELWLG